MINNRKISLELIKRKNLIEKNKFQKQFLILKYTENEVKKRKIFHQLLKA